ncbi:NUDIX hydrolase [Arthrobacter sp. H14]|uniref:NUDIX hydrolase n=1 Tax=Arthrobacter sp. H14 TaxID=1312959 RepID=UPI0004BAE59D|nr:NUDIX hydrolase [Arthrobacter sp. H14]
MTTIAAPETADDIIRRIDGTISYRNPFIRVVTDQVIFPDGSGGQYSTVSSGTGLGVVAVPVANFRGQLYLGLVRQFRYPVGDHTLEFPRGGSDDLSSAEAGRELFEETGLIFDSARLLGEIRPDTGVQTTRVAVWETRHRISTVDIHHREEESGATAHWYSHGEVTGMIRQGKIVCGITLSCMAMVNAAGSLSTPF